jgi:tetratricopeptide (TPR) repeat protein
MASTAPQTLPLDLALQQAVAHHQAGRLHEAEQLYRAILQAQPRHAEANHNLGTIACQVGQHAAGLPYLQAALSINPNHEQFLLSCTNALLATGRVQEAQQILQSAMQRGLNSAAAQSLRKKMMDVAQSGTATETVTYAEMQRLEVLFNTGQIAEMENAARALIEQHPQSGFAWKAFGSALLKQKKNALHELHRAATLLPHDAEVLSNLGTSLKDDGQFEEAVIYYGRALEIHPDFAMAHLGLGCAMESLCRFDEAMASYRRALEINPDFAEAHNNLGSALLVDLGQMDAAVASYQRALKIQPDYAKAHWNLSMPLLAQGHFTQGWQEYEYRWKAGAMPPRGLVQPRWLGDAELSGKAILLHAEQGFGDTLQFVRYATLVAARGATVYLEVPSPLKSLASSCAGVAAVFAPGETLPPYDYQCPLMSLPLACKTELATIPADLPYLAASAAKIAYWQEKLGKKTALRVGLTWAGNPRDHLAAGHRVRVLDRQRSIHFDRLLPLLEIPGIEFISLQVGDEARRQADGNPRLIDFTDELRDFEDTAALVANLDMAICVDTSVAHLVGAVGKPVWLLNRYNTCWRWLTEREDSPWYPSMRIFRQPSMGDWDSVIADVKRALAQVVSGLEQR